MRIHIISIGGAVMHNIAIALEKQGHEVSGSDDEIYDPSKSRLEKVGLLPQEEGWFPDRLTADIDLCILGMHARENNPEIKRARMMGIPIMSFPEFIADHAENKKRVVIGGSHGKTTTTSTIMHVLRQNRIDFDYLVGAQVDGFEDMVRLSPAPVMIIEGDEYLSSALDRRAKFIHYEPHISVLTGIAWDHMNVFPTFEEYLDAFRTFLENHEEDAEVFYYSEDEHLPKLIEENEHEIHAHEYQSLPYKVTDEAVMEVQIGEKWYPTNLVGSHNAQNLAAVVHVCKELGLTDEQIGNALKGFSGASKRMQLLKTKDEQRVYRDFAHAPSKVKATLEGVSEQFPDQKWIAVVELHTYSSLNADFLPQYKDSLQSAEKAIVFYSPHTVEMKKMEPLSEEKIRGGFNDNDKEHLRVADSKEKLEKELEELSGKGYSLLMMSSGTFEGIDLEELADTFIS